MTTLKYQARLTHKALRRAKTQTLIQVGALIKLAGLFSLFDIEEGEDLHPHPQSDKAAILLGLLLETANHLSVPLSVEQKATWRKVGLTLLKTDEKGV